MTCATCGHPITHNQHNLDCNVCRHGKKRYGLDRLQQQELLESQGGVCAICSSPALIGQGNQRGVIDHNHETGEVRGVLCGPCNVALGRIELTKDPIQWANNMIKYIGE